MSLPLGKETTSDGGVNLLRRFALAWKTLNGWVLAKVHVFGQEKTRWAVYPQGAALNPEFLKTWEWGSWWWRVQILPWCLAPDGCESTGWKADAALGE